MYSYLVFDENSERYDKWYQRNYLIALNEAKAVRKALGDPVPQPCLEIGVGTGWFASRAGCTFGLDPAAKMLEKAKKRGIEVIQGVGERLPIRSSSLSSIAIIVTICFTDKPLLILRESYRSLRSKGLIVVCIVPRDSAWGRYYTGLGEMGHVFYSIARFYTVSEVKEMMEVSGFQVEDVIATLSFKPRENPVLEEPRLYTSREGFACIRGVKRRLE